MTMEMIAEGLEKSTQADSGWFTAAMGFRMVRAGN